MPHPFRLSWLLVLAVLAAPATAQTRVYKCTGANGRVSFQDTPCSRRSRQQTLRMPTPPPAVPPPASAATAPPPAAAASVAAPPPPPPAPPPQQLYACVRATDGKHYVSRHGRPQAYLAPSGMVDGFSTRSGGLSIAGSSAPELNRGKVTPGLIGGGYVWVQDRCRPMSFDEVCHTLQDEYDANEHKLRNAFQSDRAPLQRRKAELEQELAGCRP